MYEYITCLMPHADGQCAHFHRIRQQLSALDSDGEASVRREPDVRAARARHPLAAFLQTGGGVRVCGAGERETGCGRIGGGGRWWRGRGDSDSGGASPTAARAPGCGLVGPRRAPQVHAELSSGRGGARAAVAQGARNARGHEAARHGPRRARRRDAAAQSVFHSVAIDRYFIVDN